MITKEQLEAESDSLDYCPFCGGKAEFRTNKSKQILIVHYPESGVVCPAIFEQYCESFEQGKTWWNKRKDYG